ncbi:hypothetical protein [Gudongella sp. SC589]|uniref:hypothetical protein n=1 Tax=Gudongella sp. SC589 TaxID=3385990 RepID=UPI00390495DF
MKVNLGVRFHNRFDFVITDVSTGEVSRAYAALKPQAENIVLNRMYERLLGGNPFFSNIVFGTGDGTLDPSRTTLFNRLGYVSAQLESLVRSYPTSIWTQVGRLESHEYNDNDLTEVGISETTTNINTHAKITDSEGNPLTVPKRSNIIIDIYATVYAEVYSVDSGCFFYGDGLRNYLTGASAPNNVIALNDLLSQESERISTLTASKSTNLSEKSMTLSGNFSVYDFNRDVKAIDWVGGGLRWKLPRPGVYTGTNKTNVEIGTGDGINKTFELPNQEVTSLTIRVDGVVTSAFEHTFDDKVVFDTAPADGLLITADYTTKYMPKDEFHELPITMKITFGASQPSPVVPDPTMPNDLPGPQTLSGGDESGGYFGEVSALDLISGEDLCNAIGLTAGTLQESDAGWLKYYNNDEIIYIAKRTFRHTISWNDINTVGAIFGDKKIAVGNHVFAVRALSTAEWNKLIYPVHVNYGTWASFTDADLRVHYTYGNGSRTWTSTPSGSNRHYRGFNSVELSNSDDPSSADSRNGFRPVLVYLYTLPS